MKIGIDIDGVIVDTINFVSKALTKHYGYEIRPEDVVHGLSRIKGIDKYFLDNGNYLLFTLEPNENAVEIINELGNGHEIYLISARFQIHYEATINWLEKYGVKVKKLLFTDGKSKVELCKQYGIGLFIEDSGVNASEIARINIPVLLLDTEYNQFIEEKGIFRCKDWKEIYSCMKEITAIDKRMFPIIADNLPEETNG